MAKLTYIDYTFQAKTVEIISTANRIIAEYQAEGYDLTLRQLYYQFVARDLIPNTEREYGKLGSIISKARMAGLIDWDSIVDRTRRSIAKPHWEQPQDIIEACAEQFNIDTRSTQDYYIEVWIEKDALVGVLEHSCEPLDIRYFSCRGYVSQSAMWQASIRLSRQEKQGKMAIVLHLGDHDPSGIDMTRDIQDRLAIFGCKVVVNRIALKLAQVEHFKPPPNPAKVTDSRFAKYMERYGDKSWELDALDPKIITRLVEREAALYTDEPKRNKLLSLQRKYRKQIRTVADNWDDLVND